MAMKLDADANEKRRNAVHENFSRADAILFSLAIVSAVLFVLLLPRFHPDSAADFQLGEEKAISIATSFLETHGAVISADSPRAVLARNVDLLNSLQAEIGRPAALELFRTENSEILPGYFWRVSWGGASNQVFRPAGRIPAGQSQKVVYLTGSGRVWQFSNPGLRVPGGINSRNVLIPILKKQAREDGLRAGLPSEVILDEMGSIADSTYGNLLFFNIPDTLSNEVLLRTNDTIPLLDLNRLKNNLPQELDARVAALMARYHLRETVYESMDVRVDSVWTLPEGNRTLAVVQFASNELTGGHEIRPRVTVSSSGALVEIRTDFTSANNPDSSASLTSWKNTVGGISLALLVLSIVLFSVIFFRRLSGRMLDINSALMDAILACTCIIVFNGLFLVAEFSNIWEESTVGFVQLVVGILFGAAGGGLAMFLVAGGTDSVRRSIWPEKGFTLGMMRRLQVHNQPVGWAFLRGAALALVMLGGTTLVYALAPAAVHVFSLPDSGSTFIRGDSSVPYLFSLFLWIFNGLLVLSVILHGFGMWLSQGRKAWVVVLGTALVYTILQPGEMALASGFWPFVISGLLGACIGWVFWKYDFLTAFCGFLVFNVIWDMSPGWLAANSPFWVSALFSVLLLGLLIAAGIVNLYTGKLAEDVPTYVPAYLAEMAQQERAKRELEIAREVQESFLPKSLPKFDAIEIAAVCRSAQEVGGDYYDIINLGNQRFGLAIGDVSGKGIQAAFFTTLVKGLLQPLAHDNEDPAQVLRRLNSLFVTNAKPGMFITMIYGVFDLNNFTFTFARAGHNPLLLKRANDPIPIVFQPNGLGIGLVDGGRFDETIRSVSITMDPGDVMVLFTDGVPEAMNTSRVLYSQQRLMDKVGLASSLSPPEIIDSITSDVKTYSEKGEPTDDMTMVVIKVKPTVSAPRTDQITAYA